jgi:predicted extracellular nuclease
VVVGDFQEDDQLKGFYLQEEDLDHDGDPGTSEGIFVYDPAHTLVLNPGDGVRLRGTAYEYYDVTQISYVTAMTTCTPAGPANAAILDLPVPDVADFEHYEGMLVSFPDTLTASQNYFQGRYGQVTLSEGGRMFQPTQIFDPGSPEMFDLADENLRRMVVLDDDTTQQNPYPIPYIGEDDTLRAGDTVDGLVGVVDFGLITSSGGNTHYRIRPVEEVTFTRVNEREDYPMEANGSLRIASFNVFNFFNGDGTGGGFPTSRGADTYEEYKRQRKKIENAIVRIDPDVIGLMEIENDAPPLSALEDLVRVLNLATNYEYFDFIDTGMIGDDEIKVALIYKTERVTPIGDFAILDSSVDPDYNSDLNRPALAQSFVDNDTGRQFTVVVNHLKSKGSDCDDVGDPDTGDGQGNCNLTRTAAAIAEANWLATNPTGYGEGNYMVIGDLNAYMMEDPITALEDLGLSNILMEHIGATAYSYIFDGGSGTLDHALASWRFAQRVEGVQIWQINADEPSVIDYNTEYKSEDLYTQAPFRSSDHDPVIIDLNMYIDVFFSYIPLVTVP